MDPRGHRPAGSGERGLVVRGLGPLLASTCRELAVWTPWDVNGYYRVFGFRFGERPTKSQLRHAFERLHGHEDSRLTEILHVLLRQRNQYDRSSFGEPFFDRMFTEMLKRAAERLAWAAGRAQAEVLDDWGFRDLPDDFAELEREFLAENPSARRQPWASVTWPWSWYLDRTLCEDIPRLAVWQQLLVRHLPVPRFAVGLSGYGDPVSARLVGGEWAVFLRDDLMPDDGWARMAGQQAQSSVTTYALPHDGTRRTMKYQGGRAAAKTVEDETSFSSNGRRYSYISSVLKKKGDSVIIRFVDDIEMPPTEQNFWITLATHDYVPVKDSYKSNGDGKKRPRTMTAICRTQGLLQGAHEECYICDNLTKPDKKGVERRWSKSGTTFARAIHRERVKITQADVDAGDAPPEALDKWAMHDTMVEVDELNDDGKPTGRKVMRPEIFLVQQKWSNFFEPISIMAQEYDDTVLDRDWKITRTAEGLETDYTPAPLNQTPGFTLADPETRKVYDDVFSFDEMIEFIDNLHSDEYYGRFFNPNWVDPEEEKAPSRPAKTASAANVSYVDDEGEEDAPAVPAGKGVSKDKRDALKARMMGKKSEPAETAPSSDETDDEALANA